MPARRKKQPLAVDAEFDRRMMASALRLGRRNLGQTGTNPAVGCIVVRGDGETPVVVGRGWTAVGGRPHAERQALAEAGEGAKGATAYVTLEPCAHKRRGGSCSAALIEAGVARVVTAMADPDPRTNGKGHAALEAAGIAVTTGVLADQAAVAHSGHISLITKGRPHVTLKLAISADGMIGRREGERMMVTGKATFDAVQRMRTEFDALMVGIGTVLVDDPRLTVRLPGLEARSPARVILDAEARIPPTSRLIHHVDETPLIVFTALDAPTIRVEALVQEGVKVIPVPAAAGKLDLTAVLSQLAAAGHQRVLAEGGAEVASSLVQADLLDEVVLFRAPVVVGLDGVRALGGMALSAIERSPRYRLIETALVGEDVMRRYIRAA
jgi:diaminohydroxyphosphoribosylaminopyrimidine deaminase/5-amino-6-(5-phosphoribosylamino)uracil reductase